MFGSRACRNLEALEDVDTGNVIDHQAIQAWADSLDTVATCLKYLKQPITMRLDCAAHQRKLKMKWAAK